MNNTYKEIILFILLVITVIFITTKLSLSKYTTIHSSSTSREVGKYVVDLSNEKESEIIELNEIIPGENRELIFKVVNSKEEKKSDVTISYNLEIETLNNLPLKYSIYEYDEENNDYKETEINLTNNKSDNTFSLSHTENENKYKLLIKWEENNENIDYRYSKEIDYIKIKANTYQSD